MSRHDDSVGRLNEMCAKCHIALVRSPELAAAYHNTVSPKSLADLRQKYPLSKGAVEIELSLKDQIGDYFGAYPGRTILRYWLNTL
jgi:hypothetical protein